MRVDLEATEDAITLLKQLYAEAGALGQKLLCGAWLYLQNHAVRSLRSEED